MRFAEAVNMTRACDKKAQSVHDIYVQYRSELCCHVVSKVGVSNSEAEDIVQTAFARLTELDIAAIDNHRAFLYKTSYNLAIDLKRKGRVRQKYSERLAESCDESFEEPGPERLLEGRRQLEIITRAMWAMPRKRRQLLMMSRFDGLSYAEIARRVQLSETVVRKHICKAMADCQRALQAHSN